MGPIVAGVTFVGVPVGARVEGPALTGNSEHLLLVNSISSSAIVPIVAIWRVPRRSI